MGTFSTHAELENYSRTTTLFGVLAAFFTWTTLYFTLCLINSKRSYEWNCRLIAILHALVVVVMAYWCGFVQGSWPFTDAGTPNTKLQHWTVCICLGYFVYDLLWCLYFQTEGPLMMLHHIMSIYGTGYVLYARKSGIEMVATIFGAELTNPFLQMRWFLRTLKVHKTWYAEVNDHIFMLLFGYLRIGVGSYLLYTTLTSPLPAPTPKFGAISFYTVSWGFWVTIIQYASKKYKKKFKSWKEQKLLKLEAEQAHGDTNITNGISSQSSTEKLLEQNGKNNNISAFSSKSKEMENGGIGDSCTSHNQNGYAVNHEKYE